MLRKKERASTIIPTPRTGPTAGLRSSWCNRSVECRINKRRAAFARIHSALFEADGWPGPAREDESDARCRNILIPLENKRNFLEVSGDIVERVDPVFFSDPTTAPMKALGMT
jgi:hypothetical protein